MIRAGADGEVTTGRRPGTSEVAGGLWQSRFRRFGGTVGEIARNPTAAAGAIAMLLIILMAIFAPLIVTPNQPDPSQMPRDWANPSVPPGSPDHILGTTANGGDVLYGIIWGARTSVMLAAIVVSATLFIGVLYGGVAAMVGGKLDEYMMRVVDVFQAVPALILAIAIAGTLGPSFRNITLALILAGWTDYARLIRGEILKVKGLEFVDAAYAIGDKRSRVFLREILPNSFTPIVVLMTIDAGKVVLAGATLSFVGLAEAGLAEWGNLVAQGQGDILAGRWWVATFGGLMVFIWALAANLFGDGLRDVFDPRTEKR